MLKILQKNLKLTIDGEIEVKKASIKKYEEYVKDEIKKQKKEEILKYLKTNFKYKYGDVCIGSYAYKVALEDIAEYLSNQECEDEGD